MGVSRQAISKWETGEAYPETEKLIALCDYFDVSIDAFVRADLAENAPTEPKSTADSAEKEKLPLSARRKAVNTFIGAIAAGVFLVLLGVAACVAVNGYALLFDAPKSDRIAGTGVAVLLAAVALAVFLFVFFGIRHDAFTKQCGGKIECDYTAAEKKRFNGKFTVAIACLACAVLLDVAALVLVSIQIDSGNLRAQNADAAYCFTTAAFLGVLALAVGGLTVCGMLYEKVNGKTAKARGKNKIADAVCGTIMLLCTALFLLLGFAFDRWHPGWVAFPIGGILCAAVNTVSGALGGAEEKENGKAAEKDDDAGSR